MSTEAPRTVRDDLASLRIDRNRPKPESRGGRGRAIAIGAGVLLLAGAAAVAWRSFGAPLEVKVVYAQRSEPGGAAASGAVLSGSGYVVTGDKYISIGVRVAGRID